ncbi:MAG: VOC family protein [Planctomycetota bacterium]
MDRVCHFEVPYDDKQRMEQFYSGVFGWQFMEAPGDAPYTFAITAEMDETFQIKQSGGINGGTYARGGDGPSKTPLIVIEVDDCAQRIKDVEAAGGSNVLGPHQVGDMGIYAQVKDCEDNIVGLWQPLPHG